MDHEFEPEETDAALAAFDRRTFLKLAGSSLAAAGAGALGACSRPQPAERIVPYVRQPENVVPGLPRFYASVLPGSGFASGFGRGVVVESHEGRPTKIEGNPKHPSSLGATDTFMQASVLQLYDPDRSRGVIHDGLPSTWGKFVESLEQFIGQRGGPNNVRVRLLTRTMTSPAIAAQIQALQKRFKNFAWHVDDLPGNANARAGQQKGFGRAVTPIYDFTKARRIVSLDAQFLSSIEEPGALRYAREFASRRRYPIHAFGPNQVLAQDPAGTMPDSDISRFYMAESTLSFTGARADHRLPVPPSMIPKIALALLDAVTGRTGNGALPAEVARWVAAVASDLRSHKSEALVLAGEYHLPDVHATAHATNAQLGAFGATVRYVEPVDSIPREPSLATLKKSLDAGDVDLLLMMDVNPVFTAPSDLAFSETLEQFSHDKTRLAIHAGGYVDETAAQCQLHIGLSHALESWGDLRGHDGTAAIVQPLIEPLGPTKSVVEVLQALLATGESLAGESAASSADRFASGYDLIRRHWLDQWKDASPAEREMRWRKALRDGIIEGTAAKQIDAPTPDAARIRDDLAAAIDKLGHSEPIELVICPDPSIADGESGWANHPWLQELPKPLSHVTWENIAMISPATAAALGFNAATFESRGTVPVIRVTAGNQTIDTPAWIQLGHPDNCITLHLGGGHSSGGDLQRGIGTNVFPLRTSADPWHVTKNVRVETTSQRAPIACTQATPIMSDRDVARSKVVGEKQSTSRSATKEPATKSVSLSLYPQFPYTGYRWGMVIDLSACIGCNACVIACQAENNIPTVGKEQVRRGREMHWIRIDTYFGSAETRRESQVGANPQIHFQPMLCQHCETAPCEVVCPVEATTHSEEGINEMTYNRCVGTRYCSNNCPYKVRRFNFLSFNLGASTGVQPGNAALAAMQKNPNVTVRSRGVMEKCTYCIQRINRARIAGKRDWAKGEALNSATRKPPMREPKSLTDEGTAIPLPRLAIQTACQQACPTEAIVFGDLNDAGALAARLRSAEPWKSDAYSVLEELNTNPRTTYVPRLLNPNPALAGGAT